MQCGAPVICSNATSLPEVTGEAASYSSPTDAEAYVGALQRLAADEALRQELSLKSLRRAENFSWSKTAQIVENTYLQTWQQERNRRTHRVREPDRADLHRRTVGYQRRRPRL